MSIWASTNITADFKQKNLNVMNALNFRFDSRGLSFLYTVLNFQWLSRNWTTDWQAVSLSAERCSHVK